MKNQKGFTSIVITVIIALVLALGGGAVYYVNKNKTAPPMACTMEAKICPDGSSVGRTGPKCEFAECPKAVSAADWKTYKNVVYGFELRYPGDYKFLENSVFDEPYIKLEVIGDKNPELGKPNSFHLYVKDAKQTSLTGELDWFKKNFDNVLISQKKIGDKDFTIIQYDTFVGSTYPSLTAFIEHGGFLYVFDTLQNLENVIATFRFTK